MSARKLKVRTAIRVNAYRVVSDAVERGALRGVRRAYKHTDTPTPEYIASEVESAVTLELSEVLDFGED